MVTIDGLHNGWRHLVLPITHTDQLVVNAVLAASAFHLSINDTTKSTNPSRTPATPAVFSDTRLCKQRHPNCTTLYAYTIMGPHQRQELGDSIHGMDRHIVLLTILVLLVAVMIAGSDDFPILLRMLQSAFEAIGGEEGLGRGVFAEFMIRQIHRMRVYAAPFVSEESGFATISSLEQTTQGLPHCSQQRRNAAAAVPLITSLVQQAHDIYLWQALRGPPSCSPLSHPSSTTAGQTPPPSTVLVQRFKETLEAFPCGSPGEQILIRATFIAASDAFIALLTLSPSHSSAYNHLRSRAGSKIISPSDEKPPDIDETKPGDYAEGLVEELAEPGHEVLPRVYNIWTASAYQVLMMASWTCNIVLYSTVTDLGGPMMLIYSTIIVTIGQCLMMSSLAEMCAI
ncbi:hypothetical protein B0J12DRAFT_737189 [Macrophomina phaseolina]|uniref:Uncharacterized protein n=1 Tax=Macrophomina phaseolina TaxID=35725 RepID=A0ABQ8GQN8_9PEZI|nr:hypothetical protein B0J12DRAFT_737189 [Macrophomina phaseolina]